MRKIILYSLRLVGDKTILSMDLSLKITKETNTTIEVNLPKAPVTLNKWEYFNKFKIFDDGNVFFVVCNKSPAKSFVKKKLLEYAIPKIDTKIDLLQTLKNDYQKQLAAA